MQHVRIKWLGAVSLLKLLRNARAQPATFDMNMITLKTRWVGFTLIELMVVIAIIVTLVGILVPVFSQVKGSAKRTDDLNKLRQLGVAAHLYQEAYGQWPTSATQIYEDQHRDVALLSALTDTYPSGFSNELMAFEAIQFPAYVETGVFRRDYRLSFVGSRDFIASQALLDSKPEQGRGWVIEPIQMETYGNESMFAVALRIKRYLRLNFDGSVVTRLNPAVKGADGKLGGCVTQTWLFYDFDLKERQDFCDNPGGRP